MRWTKDRPTMPGWWRCMLYHPLDGREKLPTSMVLEVWRDFDGELVADAHVEAIALDDDRFVAWGDGPIPEPDGEVPR